jgi:hypothetical protein
VTTILLSIGIIVVFAIIFWLDRKQDPEPTHAIIHLFGLLQNLNWEMDKSDIKSTFPAFSRAKLTSLNRKSTLSLKEYHEDQKIYTTLSFANDGEAKVNKVEIKLFRINQKDIDLLFRTICKQYGQPEQNDSGLEGSVKWATEPGVLTLENTAPEEYMLTIKEEKVEPLMV